MLISSIVSSCWQRDFLSVCSRDLRGEWKTKPGFNLKQGHEASVALGTVGSWWRGELQFQDSLMVAASFGSLLAIPSLSLLPQEARKELLPA